MTDVSGAVAETVRRTLNPEYARYASQRADYERWWRRGGALFLLMTGGLLPGDQPAEPR